MSVAIIAVLVAAAAVALALCCLRARRPAASVNSVYDPMSNDELRNALEMKLNRRCSR